MKRPFEVRAVESAAGDGERLDDEPGVAVIDEPRFGVETVAEVRGVGVDVVQRAAYQHRPAFLTVGVDVVDLERGEQRAAVDDVVGTGPQRDQVRPSGRMSR
jgi:hypothetical protein